MRPIPGARRPRVDTTFRSLFDRHGNTSCELGSSGPGHVRDVRGGEGAIGRGWPCRPLARRRGPGDRSRVFVVIGGNRLHSLRYRGTPAATRDT